MSLVVHSARAVDADGEVDGFWLLAEGDVITRTGTGQPPVADEVVDAGGRRLVPGFVDLHCHGGGGHAVEDGPEAMRGALALHRRHGTTRSVVSLVSAPVERLLAALGTVADVAAADPLVLGSHLEGPWLAPSRRGAHDAEHLHPPDPGELRELLAAARGTLRQVTLAPELPGALDAIEALVAAGVRVAVGHTEADHDTARRAFHAGATLLTHAFNAMPGIGHRAPGPVVAAIEDERVVLELILDGEHVHPAVAGLLVRAAPGRVALVTDAMAAAGAGDGDHRLGELDVTVRGNRAVVTGTETLAGSTLTQDAALRAALACGLSPAAAVAAVTTVPAGALGLDGRVGSLRPGRAADAVLLDDAWHPVRVWAGGRPVPPAG